MKPILECVPNFSEGRNPAIYQAIAQAVSQVPGVKVLNIDPGASTNRTVITFAGEPEAVIEGAFLAIERAKALIDMRKHQGAHPRMGATDVCPLVPIAGISIEEAVLLAHRLAERVGKELGIPVYLYEYAAQSPSRKSLAEIRAGEYEGFEHKIILPEWKPDYGPAVFNPTAGQTVIGVRDFLVAYNVNLNTTSVKRANAVAFDIREAGRVKQENGKNVIGPDGEPERIPGTLKHCRAIGWYIDEFGLAQVSMNLTNIQETPLHEAFVATEQSALSRGMRVIGSEIVGLVPKSCLVEAGKYFLKAQQRSLGVPDQELIQLAIQSMGLSSLYPFKPEEKIIEYLLADDSPQLTEKRVIDFAHAVLNESPAPGGGSVAALIGALGASLGGMVANISAHKKGWESTFEAFSQWASEMAQLQSQLLNLVEADTAAYNGILTAFQLPKKTPVEQQARLEAIEAATRVAIEVPLQIMETAAKLFPLLAEMIEKGNPNCVTDGGVGVLCVDVAIKGGVYNALINLKDLKDDSFRKQAQESIQSLLTVSQNECKRLSDLVAAKLNS
jgi:glutamate formiminotransferase / formiminotetrahydrofolate cyclodeaminase